MSRHAQEAALGFENLYLLEELRDPLEPGFRPFYSYYVVAYLIKEPLALQVLFVLGMIAVTRQRSFREFLVNEWFLVAPGSGCVSDVLICQHRADRHPPHPAVFPFLLVIASASWLSWRHAGRGRRFLLGALMLYLTVSVLSCFPHMIPYMNELVGNRRKCLEVPRGQ